MAVYGTKPWQLTRKYSIEMGPAHVAFEQTLQNRGFNESQNPWHLLDRFQNLRLNALEQIQTHFGWAVMPPPPLEKSMGMVGNAGCDSQLVTFLEESRLNAYCTTYCPKAPTPPTSMLHCPGQH